MSEKIGGGMPEGLDIGGSWQIVWAAVDPTTGADVSGVVVSNANVVATPLAGGGGGETVGPFMLVPGPGA